MFCVLCFGAGRWMGWLRAPGLGWAVCRVPLSRYRGIGCDENGVCSSSGAASWMVGASVQGDRSAVLGLSPALSSEDGEQEGAARQLRIDRAGDAGRAGLGA